MSNLAKRGLIGANWNRSKQFSVAGEEAGKDDDTNNYTTLSNDLQRLLDKSLIHSAGGRGSSLRGGLSTSKLQELHSSSDKSATDNQLSSMATINEKCEILFQQFLEVLQGRITDAEIFDTVQDLIHVCIDVLDNIQKDFLKSGNKDRQLDSWKWLEQEMKTWKLLYALYKDRILVQRDEQNTDNDIVCLSGSEKDIVAHLYSANNNLREYQLIIDWQEACYERRDYGPLIGDATRGSVAWENTLFQLKKQQHIAFGTGGDIVNSLDPDAPVRERKPLHALDVEDNLRLSRSIFEEIRQGKIDEAITLCKLCGQSWRAAILEGWRLHEDPNYDTNNANGIKLPIEGNPRRDIWKKCAWFMADNKQFDEYTRAIAGAFCGHIDSMKAVLCNSWEDLLWAYLKVQVDIRVESEIRNSCTKPYVPMPDGYWNSKMTLEQIFDELSVHNDISVRNYAQSKVGVIQKYLILDNFTELLSQIQEWINADDAQISNEAHDDTPMNAQMHRFLAHIVLFMRQIGRVDKEEYADNVIAAYVESLIRLGDAQLVAFYTAALPTAMQTALYSKFLYNIHDTAKRSTAIEEALNAGLDIENITKHTVQNIREELSENSNNDAVDADHLQNLKAGEISNFDWRKIKSLEWLKFLPIQRAELLWQANAMMRTFLAENKSECVQEVYKMIPQDSLSEIIQVYGFRENLPYREQCSIKEYLSYRVYLTAIDNFTDWSTLQRNRPKEPETLNNNANFTERVASEHKEQLYRAELNRWNANLEEQTKICRDSLYNILLFPDKGWLIDPEPMNGNQPDLECAIWQNRQLQLEKLRMICIPEIVLLLHQVLHTSGDYQGCVKLADDLASESRLLYKVYTKHKLAELLAKLADSSLELLNRKLDPWGFPTKNGYIKRIYDEDINSMVLEIMGTNVSTIFISAPKDPKQSLGIKLPFLVLLIKNMHKYFTFEVQIIDDQRFMRRFRVSNFHSKTSVKPFCTSMPMGMSPGWNQIHFNLADFTRRAYGTSYMETVRLQIHANVRIRRIYFTDHLYQECDLPNEYRLISHPRPKKGINFRIPSARPSSPQTTRTNRAIANSGGTGSGNVASSGGGAVTANGSGQILSEASEPVPVSVGDASAHSTEIMEASEVKED